MSDFSEKLIELMNLKNVNQTILSNETGIKQSSLSGWLNSGKKPRPDKIEILSNYFNVPVSYFFNNEPTNVGNQPGLQAVIDKSLTNYEYNALLKKAGKLTNDQLKALNNLLDSFNE